MTSLVGKAKIPFLVGSHGEEEVTPEEKQSVTALTGLEYGVPVTFVLAKSPTRVPGGLTKALESTTTLQSSTGLQTSAGAVVASYAIGMSFCYGRGYTFNVGKELGEGTELVGITHEGVKDQLRKSGYFTER